MKHVIGYPKSMEQSVYCHGPFNIWAATLLLAAIFPGQHRNEVDEGTIICGTETTAADLFTTTNTLYVMVIIIISCTF